MPPMCPLLEAAPIMPASRGEDMRRWELSDDKGILWSGDEVKFCRGGGGEKINDERKEKGKRKKTAMRKNTRYMASGSLH